MGPPVLRKDPSRRRSRSGAIASPARGRGSGDAGAPGAGRARRRDETRSDRFVLYVEGARDREILASWARRAEPGIVRCIERNSVILGGRQPARAVRDFERRGGASQGWRGLVVLDRDHHEEEAELEATFAPAPAGGVSPGGLELFVWSLRHIESYLLVPAAIGRVLGVAEDDPRVERALAVSRAGTVPEPLAGLEDPHAKRILGSGGALSEALGRTLPPGAIARAMRREDLHEDVHALFARIGHLTGAAVRAPEIVVRRPPR